MKVIADIGSNWKTIEDCLTAVKFAAKDGIDIVKFQYFTHEKLYGKPGQIPGELPKSWISRIRAQCDAMEVGFMCSVFDPADVEFLDKQVDMHKIASAEANYPELHRELILKSSKDILVSTGCLDPYETSILCPRGRYVHMACVSEYPANSYPWDWMLMLRDQKQKWGLSDHCKGFHGYEIAYHLGASYYEFHYNPLEIPSVDSHHSKSKFVRPVIKEYEPNTAIARVKTDKGWFRALNG